MNKNFNELGISAPILKAIEDMGFQTPTEVQSRVIPHILDLEDLIVMSKTGSGKTAVFGIPLLQLSEADTLEPQALILTPTRELAVQIESDLKQMSAYLPHKITAVYGQHSMNIEIQALNKGPSIVVGTPGRVFDHIRHGNLKVKKIRFFVLDEADRMLDMGFIDQVFKIIKTLPKNRNTLLFSATIPPEIQSICRGYMKDPVRIEIESKTKTVDTIDQTYYRVNRNEKRMQLHRLLMIERPDSCLIFCNTRYAVDQVQKFLATKGYASEALHGDIPQSKRLKIMQEFKEGKIHLLVATDVAARGIHIEDLSLVINYDVPQEKDNYVHRIGRTGRAGKGGRSITFATSEDIMSLYEIEEHINAQIPESNLPGDSEVAEHKAAAEQWIREKYKESSLAPSSAPRETKKREPNDVQDKADGDAQKKKRKRRRSSRRPDEAGTGTESGAPQERASDMPAATRSQRHQSTPRHSSESRNSSEPRQSSEQRRSSESHSAPRSDRSGDAAATTRPPRPQTAQPKAEQQTAPAAKPAKTPLIKRVLDKLINKGN
jgi:superfamily II DNA/RNA helicase